MSMTRLDIEASRRAEDAEWLRARWREGLGDPPRCEATDTAGGGGARVGCSDDAVIEVDGVALCAGHCGCRFDGCNGTPAFHASGFYAVNDEDGQRESLLCQRHGLAVQRGPWDVKLTPLDTEPEPLVAEAHRKLNEEEATAEEATAP